MFGNKRHKCNPVFDQEEYPLTPHLKEALALLSINFFNIHMRNLEVMNTSEHRLYGLMTHYDGANFCWIQPTRIKTMDPSPDYANYMKMVLHRTKSEPLRPLALIRKGTFCLARYEVDCRWYRAVVVEDCIDDHWLLLFFDYGNMQRTQCGYMIEPLNGPGNSYFGVAVQAVCCRIYNLMPRLPKHRDEIDRRLEQTFTRNPSRYYEVVVRNKRSDYVVDVDLFNHLSHSTGPNRLYRCHIGQELVDDGLATFADPEAAHICKMDVPEKEENDSETNEE